MKITGKVTEICPSEKTPNGQHESVEIVVETVSGEYPESMAVKFWNKEIEKLSNLSEGMQVGFDLKAKVTTIYLDVICILLLSPILNIFSKARSQIKIQKIYHFSYD